MNSNQIIVPLDVSNLADAIALVDKLPRVGFWKVGLELFVATGSDILKFLKDKQKRIFLDLKFHDIPNTVAGACRSASQYEVDLLTLHAVAGKKALQAAVEAISTAEKPPKLLAITVLTSLSSRELAFDLKIPLELPEYALQMAILAQESGIDGAVCSPQEVSQLREVCGNDFLLVCPGVRPSWAKAGETLRVDDQSRVMTPSQAIKAGADYLVIGRPITSAEDSVAAWERVCAEIEGI